MMFRIKMIKSSHHPFKEYKSLEIFNSSMRIPRACREFCLPARVQWLSQLGVYSDSSKLTIFPWDKEREGTHSSFFAGPTLTLTGSKNPCCRKKMILKMLPCLFKWFRWNMPLTQIGLLIHLQRTQFSLL